MNKKGQSLALFVLILPLIIMFLAFFIDSLISFYTKNKIDGAIKSNLMLSLNNSVSDTNKIKEAIEGNIEGESNIDVLVVDEKIYVDVNTKQKSIFSNIFDFSFYKIDISYCGNYNSKELIKGKDC